MGLLERITEATASRSVIWPYAQQQFSPDPFSSFNYGGQMYFGITTNAGSSERPPAGFAELINFVYKSNAIVFAAERVRLSVFSEGRFIYRRFDKGRPGRLWSDSSLGILENPWPRGTTSDLLVEMGMFADLGGNAFVYRDVDRLRVMRPDWVTIVLGDTSGTPVETPGQLDAEIIGFIYNPQDGRSEPRALLPEEVAHYIPPGQRDPLARYRGMSWLQPVIRDIQADQAVVLHKLAFFENGATPQLVVSFDNPNVTPENFQELVTKMDDTHSGWRNAYKTIYLGAGADVTVVGKDLQQLDFAATQGQGENRIAAASGIHPVLLPTTEALHGSSLNAGNHNSARRSAADTFFRPAWRNVCGSLAAIIPVPGGSELWYDEQNIPFLRDDNGDAATTESVKASTITTLVKDGFTAESAIAAVMAQDMTLLVHTGLVSVQLVPGLTAPNPNQPELGSVTPEPAAVSTNGTTT